MTITKRQRFTIYGVLLAIAFAALIAAGLLAADPKPPPRPQEVLAVSPLEDANEVRQATVYAEIEGGLDAALSIGGRRIPDDQLDRLQTGNLRVSFTPGAEKEFTRFPAGRTCARVEYWPVGQDPAATSKAYAWCFTLQ